MVFGRKKRRDGAIGSQRAPEDMPVGYNPNRDDTLFWLTEEGYLIAQDVACQTEYVEATSCPSCGASLTVVAHLNRAGQGLSEIVTLCCGCRERYSFIFDISNTAYQTWWAGLLGPHYVQQFDGPPREPYCPAE
jgi:hypothetical protein